jgi:acyl carrier protein
MTDNDVSGVRDGVHLVLELHLGVESVATDQRLFEDLGADSFDLMNIVVILEQSYDVSISETEAGSVSTVGDVVALVASQRQT